MTFFWGDGGGVIKGQKIDLIWYYMGVGIIKKSGKMECHLLLSPFERKTRQKICVRGLLSYAIGGHNLFSCCIMMS